MESRFWRTLAANIAIGIVIEYGICLAISWYFNDRNQYFYALLIMFAFWAVQLGVWMKSQIVGLVLYYLAGKQQMIARIESQLRRFKMPLYDEIAAPDSTIYLTRVAEDNASSSDQVKLAASTAGAIQMLHEIKPTAAWKMMSAFEAALDNYRRQAPIELHRTDGSAVSEKDDDNSGSFLTSAVEELSEEETTRQTVLVGRIQLKGRWASVFAWNALKAELEDDERHEHWKRYLMMRDEVLGMFVELTDEWYRDFGAHCLVELLTIAGETDRAQQIIDGMTVDYIKEKAMADLASGARVLYARVQESSESGKGD